MRDGFRARLKILMAGARPYSFAKNIGIAKGLFQYYWQKGGMPTSENLLKIQMGTGCSLDWLLTGRAPVVDEKLTNLEFDQSTSEGAVQRQRFVATVRKLKKIYAKASPEKLRAFEAVIEVFSKQREKGGTAETPGAAVKKPRTNAD